MKVSKRLALSAVAVAGIAFAMPAMASGGPHATSGSATKNCADGVITYDPTTLWPPNHQWVTVNIDYSDTDNDGDMTSIMVNNVTDNQTTGGIEDPGSGNTGTDWQFSSTPGTGSDKGTDTSSDAKTSVQVRAERSGRDGSRVYDINVTCTDSGSTTDPSEGSMGPKSETVDLFVTVPHDQGNSPKDNA